MLNAMYPWIQAARLRTLPLAVSGIILANFMAAKTKTWSPTVCALSVITAVFLQILSNYANDYGDTQHGADNSYRQGPPRAVQSGLIKITHMKFGIILLVFLSLLSGITLLSLSLGWFTWYFNIFFVVGILAIVAAYTYTAGILPYGYKGFGDLSVFIFFGPVSVLGSYFLQTKTVDFRVSLPAFSVGLLSVAVLNLNNMRDLASDKIANKITIPVRMGLKWAVIYHFVLIFFTGISACIYHILEVGIHQWMFFLVPYLYIIYTTQKAFKEPTPMALDQLLKKTALGTLGFVLAYGIPMVL